MTKKQAIQQMEVYRLMIQTQFLNASVCSDYMKGESFYNAHVPDDSWGRVTYVYTFETPLQSQVTIKVIEDTGNVDAGQHGETASFYCEYQKYDTNKTMNITGKKIGTNKFKYDMPISEQLANIHLTLIKRNV